MTVILIQYSLWSLFVELQCFFWKMTFVYLRTLTLIPIGLYYCENDIAIDSEARDFLNVWSEADRQAFAHKERHLHCDVHVAAENKRTLPPFGSLDSFWIMRSQRSRRCDKGLYTTIALF